MRLITRNADYAIRALCFIARAGNKTVSVTQLVKRLNVPRPFLRKVLQILNRSALLLSHKGKGGGFELARDPERIRVTDILEIFQGPLKLNECLLKKKKCPNRDVCPLKKKIDRIEAQALKELRAITIGSLL